MGVWVKCATCDGSGLAVEYWMLNARSVSVCSSCNGTGQREINKAPSPPTKDGNNLQKEKE